MAKNVTAYEALKDTLRRDIITGRIPGGTRLTVAELCNKYQVSAMPVREALRALQGEDLLDNNPRQGVRVKTFDIKMISDIYDVRAALELMIVEKMINNVSNGQLKKLQKLVSDYEQAYENNDNKGMLEANRTYHLYAFEIANNQIATRLFALYEEIVSSMRSIYGYASSERVKTVIREHRQIMDAMCRRDVADLKKYLTIHDKNAKEDMITVMQKHKDSESDAASI